MLDKFSFLASLSPVNFQFFACYVVVIVLIAYVGLFVQYRMNKKLRLENIQLKQTQQQSELYSAQQQNALQQNDQVSALTQSNLNLDKK